MVVTLALAFFAHLSHSHHKPDRQRSELNQQKATYETPTNYLKVCVLCSKHGIGFTIFHPIVGILIIRNINPYENGLILPIPLFYWTCVFQALTEFSRGEFPPLMFLGLSSIYIYIWVCLNMEYTPNEIAIFHRDNDQQNHSV